MAALLQRRPDPPDGAGGLVERRYLEVEAATYESGRAAICEQVPDGWFVASWRVDRDLPAAAPQASRPR